MQPGDVEGSEGNGLELKSRESHLPSPVKLSALGGLTILASLSAYQSILSRYSLETRNIELLEQTAYIVLALVLIGLCLALVGATRFFIGSLSQNRGSKPSMTVTVLSLALNEKHSFRTFVLASLIYGIFFAFVSTFFVFQPLGHFSETNGVSVPSALSVICCGPLGQMPQFVFYLTQQFAILIVPVNLVLLFIVSWLVGLNAAIATYAYEHRSSSVGSRWMGGLGALVALFTACPTCAGFFFLTMLGLTGALTLALTLSSLQGLFIAIGLPLLLVAPIVTARRVPKSWMISCISVGDAQVDMTKS
jgi:MFS family permease